MGAAAEAEVVANGGEPFWECVDDLVRELLCGV